MYEYDTSKSIEMIILLQNLNGYLIIEYLHLYMKIGILTLVKAAMPYNPYSYQKELIAYTLYTHLPLQESNFCSLLFGNQFCFKNVFHNPLLQSYHYVNNNF